MILNIQFFLNINLGLKKSRESKIDRNICVFLSLFYLTKFYDSKTTIMKFSDDSQDSYLKKSINSEFRC